MSRGLRIPTAPEDLTAEWLTAALPGDGRLAAVARHRVGEETGFTGRLVRCRLRWADRAAGPASLVAKLSTAAAGGALPGDANLTEIDFYRDMAERTPVWLPRCYYADADPAGGVGVLLLEDLGGLRPADPIAGCSEPRAARVVAELARLHAAWWGRPELDSLAWLPSIAAYAEWPVADWWESYPARIAELLPDFEPPPRLLALGRRLAAGAASAAHALAAPPLTCVHRDAHLDNLLFGGTAKEPRVAFLDWQLVGRGRGPSDLAYFLISSVEPALRRRHEADWLAAYHRRLLEGGVRGYGLDACRADYRRGWWCKLLVTMGATLMFDNTSAARRAWRRVDLERLAAFLEDHAVD